MLRTLGEINGSIRAARTKKRPPVVLAPSAHYTIDVIELTIEKGAVLVPVKAVPGASRTRIMGELEGRLKIAVAAPPEKGKANKAIIDLLAKTIGVSRRQVRVIAGHTAPFKTIRIEQTPLDAVRAALESARS